MYLKKSFIKREGRTYLSMVRGYWDKEKGHTCSQTIETFGYLDDLQKIYDDPIAHFKQVVAKRNLAEKQEAAEYTIAAKKNQTLDKNTSGRKNYGYIIIMKLLCELGLEGFLFNRRQRDTNIQCNTGAIMKMLVISRLLSPGSKKKAYEEMGRYFDFERKDSFKLIDVRFQPKYPGRQ